MRRCYLIRVIGVVLFSAILGVPLWAGPPEPPKGRADHVLPPVPLRFEPNLGQVGSPVAFVGYGPRHTVFLSPNEVVLALPGKSARSDVTGIAPLDRHFDLPAAHPVSEGAERLNIPAPTLVRMKMIGANPQPKIEGRQPLRGLSNYLTGNDRSQWRTAVPHYGRVSYQELYSGIDAVFYGNGAGLEYDLIVSPGADPSVIRFDYEGVESLRVDALGDLVLETTAGNVRQKLPAVYQEQDGRRQQVAGRYIRTGAREIGFSLGEYDRGRPLVIDPLLLFTYVGGSGGEQVWGVAADSQGNLYATGITTSSNFPQLSSPLRAGPQQGTDSSAFVVKFDPSSPDDPLTFVTLINGNGFDQGEAIRIDQLGRPIIAINTGSSNLPLGSNPLQSNFGGVSDAALFQLDPTTGNINWGSYFGGPDPVFVQDMAFRQDGIVALGGFALGSVPTTPGVFQTNAGGAFDGFITVIDLNTNQIMASTMVGGTQGDAILAVDFDSRGGIAGAGYTGSNNLTFINPFQNQIGGSRDGLIIAFPDLTLENPYLSSPFGGTGVDTLLELSWDPQGNLLSGGETDSTNLPFAGTTSYNGGAFDVFTITVPLILDNGTPLVAGDPSAFYFGTSDNDGFIGFGTGPNGEQAAWWRTTGAGDLDFTGLEGWGSCTSGTETTVAAFFPASGDTYYQCGGPGVGLDFAQTGDFTAVGGFANPGPLGGEDAWVALSQQQSSAPGFTTYSTVDGTGAEAGDPVAAASGVFFLQRRDFGLTGPMPIPFTRYYISPTDGMPRLTGTLGDNWQHNYEIRLESDGATATVHFRQGMVIAFEQQAGGWVQTSSNQLVHQLQQQGDTYRLLDPLGQLIYTFNVAAGGRLESITHPKGVGLALTYAGDQLTRVSDGLGRSLDLSYTGDRLSQVRDHAGGTVTFAYQNGRLVSMTDQAGNTTQYNYFDAGSNLGLVVSETLPRNNAPVTNTYDSEGRVVSQSDPNGNAMTLAFDQPASGQTTQTEAAGGETIFRHDSDRLTEIIDPKGNVWSGAYDANNRRLTEVNRRGGRTTYTYHAPSGLLGSVTWPDDSRMSFSYAAIGFEGFTFYRPSAVSYPDGSSMQFEYDARGNLVKRTDQLGREWRYSHNDISQVASITLPNGGAIVYTYNDDGTLASSQGPGVGPTTYSYDAAKRLVARNRPDGSVWRQTYNATDIPVEQTNEDGFTRRLELNPNGSPQRLTDEGGGVWTYQVTQTDKLASITNPLGETSTLGYDENDRFASLTVPDGSVWRTGYDPIGDPVTVTDPEGNVWRYGYDEDRRLVSLTRPTGDQTRWVRDSRSRTSRIITAGGSEYAYSYDSMSRLVSIRDPLGATTTLDYSAASRPVRVTLPDGASSSHTYDEADRLVAVTDPRGNAWRFGYDLGGRVSSFMDPLGRQTVYERDARGRVSKFVFPLGEANVTLSPGGKLLQGAYSDGTVLDYEYDAMGRLTGGTGLSAGRDATGRVIESNGITMQRDSMGRIATMTLAPGRSVTYSYDRRGLVTEMGDWLDGVTRFSYDSSARLVSVERPNGITTAYTYDAENQTVAIEERAAGVLSSISLTRDAVGRKTQAVRNTPAQPDAVALNALSLSHSFDEASRIAGFEYDAMGRRVRDTRRSYSWDLASRLVAYTQGGATTEFDYDARHLMLAERGPGGARNYVWNYGFEQPSVSVVRQNGSDVRYYLHTPSGQLLASIDADGTRRFYHFDEIGNTVFLSDDAGSVTDSYAYSPYGALLASQGATPNPFTWLGQHGVMRLGDSGLYCARRRVYDSTTAVFLSRDPEFSIDPRLLNPYQYAVGNPLSFVDVTGANPNQAPGSPLITGAEIVNDVGEIGDKIGDGAEVVAGTARFFGNDLRATENLANLPNTLGDFFSRPQPAHTTEAAMNALARQSDAIDAANANRGVRTVRALDKVGKAGGAVNFVAFGSKVALMADNLDQAQAEHDMLTEANQNGCNAQLRYIRQLWLDKKISTQVRQQMSNDVAATWEQIQASADNNLFYLTMQEGFQIVADGLDTVAPPFVKDGFEALGSWLPWGSLWAE